MSFDLLGQLNWLAVIAATIVYYAIGAVWFAPFVFGSAWQRSIGWDPAQTAPGLSAATIAVPLVAYLVSVIALGMLASATGTSDLMGGVTLGLVVGIGFAAMVLLVTAAFEVSKPQKWTWFAIGASYHLVGLVVAAIILSLWV